MWNDFDVGSLISNKDLVGLTEIADSNPEILISGIHKAITVVKDFDSKWVCMQVVAYCKRKYEMVFTPLIEEVYRMFCTWMKSPSTT